MNLMCGNSERDPVAMPSARDILETAGGICLSIGAAMVLLPAIGLSTAVNVIRPRTNLETETDRRDRLGDERKYDYPEY